MMSIDQKVGFQMKGPPLSPFGSPCLRSAHFWSLVHGPSFHVPTFGISQSSPECLASSNSVEVLVAAHLVWPLIHVPCNSPFHLVLRPSRSAVVIVESVCCACHGVDIQRMHDELGFDMRGDFWLTKPGGGQSLEREEFSKQFNKKEFNKRHRNDF